MADDIISVLTAPGAEFELVVREFDGIPMRTFRNGPRTLAELYSRSAATYAKREFLVFEGKRYSFRSFFGHAEDLRQRLGVVAGTRVGIAMRNRAEWLMAFVAITAAGGSAVLVNSRGTPDELKSAVTQTGCRLVVTDGPRADALAARNCPVPVINVDARGFAPLKGDKPLAFTTINPEAEAAIIFTTGTSGIAKGVMLSHRNIVASLMNISFSRAVAAAGAMRNLPPEAIQAMAQMQPSVLTPYPLFHVAGLNSDFLTFLMTGGKMVLMGKWDAREALRLIERERIISTSGAPAMIWDMLRAHDGTHDLSSLRGLGVGGQALPPSLFHDIRAAFPNAGFGCGYGQTETGGPVSAAALGDLIARPGNSGRPVPTFDIAFVDDDGRPCAPGEPGEIVIRGPAVAKGYCENPGETAATFRDGWVHTGDIGYGDADSYIYVVDRKKSIIISGGENISLSEVEFTALAHPDVIDAAAIGLPDERMGERLLLSVTVTPGAEPDPDALCSFMAETLSAYKLPTEIIFVDEIPRNHMAKIDRNLLRQKYFEISDQVEGSRVGEQA